MPMDSTGTIPMTMFDSMSMERNTCAMSFHGHTSILVLKRIQARTFLTSVVEQAAVIPITFIRKIELTRGQEMVALDMPSLKAVFTVFVVTNRNVENQSH